MLHIYILSDKRKLFTHNIATVKPKNSNFVLKMSPLLARSFLLFLSILRNNTSSIIVTWKLTFHKISEGTSTNRKCRQNLRTEISLTCPRSRVYFKGLWLFSICTSTLAGKQQRLTNCVFLRCICKAAKLWQQYWTHLWTLSPRNCTYIFSLDIFFELWTFLLRRYFSQIYFSIIFTLIFSFLLIFHYYYIYIAISKIQWFTMM